MISVPFMRIISLILFLLVQLIVIASDFIVIGGLVIILYFSDFNPIVFLLAILGLYRWFKEEGFFIGWKPPNIKQFFNNIYPIERTE